MIKNIIITSIMLVAICSFSFCKCMDYQKEPQFKTNFEPITDYLREMWLALGQISHDSGKAYDKRVEAIGKYFEKKLGSEADSKEPKSEKEMASSSEQK